MPVKKNLKIGKKKEAKRKNEKVKAKGRPAKKEVVIEEPPAKKVDINTKMYHNLFKFLEDKVSVECFIDLHDHCFGIANCECECHTQK
jgi:hypothetical protein